MQKPRSWNWSTIREALRWRGPLVFSLLALREILRPLVYWHVFHIFRIDLTQQLVPEPYADEKIDVRIYGGANDLDRAKAEIVSMGQVEPEEVNARFNRGDVVAIAYAAQEPAGYGWLSFTSGAVELAFGVTWIVGPGEGIRYDFFVLPKWRGQRFVSCLSAAIVIAARDHGVPLTFASISTLNRQSLTIAKHYRRPVAMKLTLVHVRGINRIFKKAVGAPFESRFLDPK